MKKINIPKAWKFLIIVIFIYLFFLWKDPYFIGGAWTDFLITLKKVSPIIGFSFFIMFILNLFLRPETIKKHLGKESGVTGWIYAVIGSILISGPPYVLMPLLANFKKGGMKISLIAVFLSNRSIQPVFLPVMAYYFGWTYTILVSILIIIFSVWSGMIIGKIIKE